MKSKITTLLILLLGHKSKITTLLILLFRHKSKITVIFISFFTYFVEQLFNNVLLIQSNMATTAEKVIETSTRRGTIDFSDRILTDFIADRNKKSLKDLKGKISFRDDYDYKSMRN